MENCNRNRAEPARRLEEFLTARLGEGNIAPQIFVQESARLMLAVALQAETRQFLYRYRDLRDGKGYARVIKNGYRPERRVMTGVGPVPIKVQRILDLLPQWEPGPITFRSAVVPPYRRQTVAPSDTLAALYLYGITTDKIGIALKALLGTQAESLSPELIDQIGERWDRDYAAFRAHNLVGKQYAHWSADGIFLSAPDERDRAGMLVLFGVRPDGTRELAALQSGWDGDAASWRRLLREWQEQGLTECPRVAAADADADLRQTLAEIFPQAGQP